MSKHHYNVMEDVHERKSIPISEIRSPILACLQTHRMVAVAYGERVYLTERGKAALRRVRGVGRAAKGDTVTSSPDIATGAAVIRLSQAGWFKMVEARPGRWVAAVTAKGVKETERLVTK